MLIHDEKFKKSILTALADDDMIKILNHAKDNLTSVTEIMEKFKIPHSTAYRKIKWMIENQLLVVEKIKITDDGKKSSLFKSMLRSIKISYENNMVTVESTRNINPMKSTAERFFSTGEE
jgi:predicted transcriptional regulator